MEAEDYPANLIEFGRRLQTDEDCRAYLERLRWPNGFRCQKWRQAPNNQTSNLSEPDTPIIKYFSGSLDEAVYATLSG